MENKPLFHLMDRTWCSTNGITLTFLPENEADGQSFISGLIPYLKASHNPWLMRLFSEDAKLRHLNSKWDPVTHQAYSADEAEIDGFLADDDELNLIGNSP